jgi:hypothetical protein
MDRRQNALAHAQAQRERWALALKDTDAELLKLRDEGLTLERLAVRYGTSATAMGLRVHRARARQATLAAMAAKV